MQQCCPSRLVGKHTGCVHLRAFKDAGGLEAFHFMQQYLQGCRYRLWDAAKVSYPACIACKDVVGRLRVCMNCIHIGCINNGHAQQHAAEKGHPLAIEAWTSEVYCALCNDFVYDQDLDYAIFVESNSALAQMQRGTRGTTSSYVEWRPSKQDAAVIAKFSKRPTVPTYQLGLRGLHNLGNTCFMNCILQSFLHNPLLRNYFLADMHNRLGCTLKQRNAEGICMGCEMDLLFSQIFSSNARAPYNPHHLLYGTWKCANSLAGYEQQDAHEFLISVLNGLHAHCGGQPTECSCVVHRIFSGSLQSSVTCIKCGNVSTKQDPMFDISLDLPKREEREEATGANAKLSLAACLQRFTSAERLGATEKYMCGHCNTPQEGIKQLSLLTLPSVICLHLKRFEHSQNGISSTKISTFVEFPEEIDMSPYLTTAARPPTPWDAYELFAVVNHHGEQVHKGHYTAFVKHNTVGWLRCDDAALSRASLQQVLTSEAYLLFYVKKCLDYEKQPS